LSRAATTTNTSTSTTHNGTVQKDDGQNGYDDEIALRTSNDANESHFSVSPLEVSIRFEEPGCNAPVAFFTHNEIITQMQPLAVGCFMLHFKFTDGIHIVDA
jgi:hypothetical protein